MTNQALSESLDCYQACECLARMGVQHPFSYRNECFDRVGIKYNKSANFEATVESIKTRQSQKSQ